ncbi:dioxygenase [Microbacterium sp. AZCO]|uniref:dioxygenase n=1 Tax=Microbacterium sp. AZCO TaxID=3142976 RepID=UPI0031F390F2
MAAGGKDRDARESRERARVYQARQQLHEDQARRRRRDNLLAGIIGGVLILGVIGAQAAYFTVGPGAPAPSPSVSPSVAPTSTDAPLPTPESTSTDAPLPAPESTPSPTPSS